MKSIHQLILFNSLSLLVSGYNINREQSNVYNNLIVKTLDKKLIVSPVRPEDTESIPLTPSVSIPMKHKEDVDGPPNYWFHTQIHTFGNTGVFGGCHAAVSPLVTLLIDINAYDGENVRNTISRELRSTVKKTGANVLDLCCGVGTSTRALRKSFGDANNIIGIDTSKEMIAMAEVLTGNNLIAKFFRSHDPTHSAGACDASYFIGNAEDTTLPDSAFDLVTIMYGFHEAPYSGRFRILREARRLLAPGATLAVVDISPDYEPSPAMLAGEPYVIEYKKNIQSQLRAAKGFDCKYKEVVKGHVGVWLLKKGYI